MAIVAVAVAAGLVTRAWSMAVLVLTVGLILMATVLMVQVLHLLRGTTRTHRRLARQARATHELLQQARSAIDDHHGDLARRTDASGRQHATIDRDVARVAEEVRAGDSQIQAALAKLAGEVEDATDLLRTVNGSVDQLKSRPAPAKSTQAPVRVTSAVPGQGVVLSMKPLDDTPSVNLVLSTFTPSGLFAGVRTAILAGAEVAQQTDRALRLVVLTDAGPSASDARQELSAWIVRETGDERLAQSVTITTPQHSDRPGYHPEDLWIATYWTTAVTMQRAVEAGMTETDRVIYLVQDWEPGFMPWGTDFALARATYDAGFTMVVNSTPLAQYVQRQTGMALPEEHVFAPQVDRTRVHAAAHAWHPSDPARPRLLAYVRPSKPRNLAGLTLDALRCWGDTLPDGTRPVVTLAGEDMATVDLGPRLDVVVRGRIDLDDYFTQLAATDLALALMYSPHPSHLPLELPMAGIPTVTNELDGARKPWVNGLTVAPATVGGLARALRTAHDQARGLTTHTAHPLPDGLGSTLAEAMTAAVKSRR